MYLTFVLPGGCNLRCPGCDLLLRNEVAKPILQPKDYLRFLWHMIMWRQVDYISIHGDEPLIAAAWPTTLRLLNMATRYGIPTGLVTNGTLLDEHKAKRLEPVCNEITISLDAAGLRHDRLRRRKGAFVYTLTGIVNAVRYFPAGSVTVSSVLYPGQQDNLLAVPELLATLGDNKPKWSIQPFIDPRQSGPEKIGNQQQVLDAVLELTRLAKQHGLQAYLENDLDQIDPDKVYEEIVLKPSIAGRLVGRLSPNGSFSLGQQVLETSDDAQIARWDGTTNPAVFVDQACDQAGLPRPERRWYTKNFA